MRVETSGQLLAAAAGRVRGRLAATGALLVVRSVADLAVPVLLAGAVTAAVDGSAIGSPVRLLCLAIVAGVIAEAAVGVVAATAAARSGAWLQVRAVRHLLSLGMGNRIPPGESTARLAQAAPAAAELPTALIGSLASVGGSAVALAALWVIDWRAGLAFVVALPLMFLIARRFVARSTAAQAGYYDAQAVMSGRLVGALAGVRTIRASGTLAVETARVLDPLPELSRAGRALWCLQRTAVWQFRLLIPLTEVLVLAVAGVSVYAGRIAPAELLAVAGYLAIAMSGLEQVDSLFELAEARAGAGRLVDILTRPPLPPGDRPRPPGSGTVRLRQVAVARDGEPLLDRLDLALPAGAAVALVGVTGAGKSTVAALIGRLADPDRGDVAIDGVPVREIRRRDLRRMVSYAFDRPALVGRTVHDAIAYGHDGVSRAEVVAAAQTAQADDFVRRLPRGYDTPLAEAPMSGGERQRLGLARALVRPARVYVFDDATSGLDTVTEKKVIDSITVLLTGRTRLIIAHRATTASRCDLVAWLDRGRIRALAPHARLWADPEYRAVFDRPSASDNGRPDGRREVDDA